MCKKCYSFAFMVTYWKPEKTSKHQCFLHSALEHFSIWHEKIYRVMQIINAAKCRTCDVDKCLLQTSQYTDPIMSAGPPYPQNTKTCSGLFRTGFHSSHSRPHFHSVARFLNNFSKNKKANTTIIWIEWFWADVYCTAYETVQLFLDASTNMFSVMLIAFFFQ